MKDFYHILGLNPTASGSDIRKKWRELARKYHPDHNPDNPLAEEHFKDAQEAYRVLSNTRLREQYDLHGGDQLWETSHPVNHYFFVRCEPKSVICFEELQLIFTYSGRGRILVKPRMPDFFITGTPYISQRYVIHEGQSVRETELTYIICPVKTGQLEIDKATITIENKVLQTEPFFITSLPNRCLFSKGNAADGKPYKLTMHYEYLPGEEPFRLSELKKNHTILIPRSRTAHIFHSIGSGLKIILTIWVMIKLSQWIHLNILVGMAAGNLVAGINCRIMYYLAGVKPKYAASRISSLAREYSERGYFLGESTGIPLISGNFWYYFGRLFL